MRSSAAWSKRNGSPHRASSGAIARAAARRLEDCLRSGPGWRKHRSALPLPLRQEPPPADLPAAAPPTCRPSRTASTMSGASSVSRSTRLSRRCDAPSRAAPAPRSSRTHALIQHPLPPERSRQRLDHRVVDARPRRPRRGESDLPASLRAASPKFVRFGWLGNLDSNRQYRTNGIARLSVADPDPLQTGNLNHPVPTPAASISRSRRDMTQSSTSLRSFSTKLAERSGRHLSSRVAKIRACVGDHSTSPITTRCANGI